MEGNELKKLAVLLNHWIRHNKDHIKDYRKWAEEADRQGLKEVAHNLKTAADLILQSNERFIAAQKGMPVSSVEEGHEHDPHDHDFTREYEIITRVVNGVKAGSVNLEIEMCGGCENINTCSIPYADALHQAFLESQMPCGVLCTEIEGRRILQMTHEGEVFMQIDPLAKEAIQRCHDDMCNTVLYNRVFDVGS
ncbi:MAG: hypothetical protein HY739_13450 [Desulfobacterales bacterium]|nr:hypothetical protein [Desulfobacterales bacterium]